MRHPILGTRLASTVLLLVFFLAGTPAAIAADPVAKAEQEAQEAALRAKEAEAYAAWATRLQEQKAALAAGAWAQYLATRTKGDLQAALAAMEASESAFKEATRAAKDAGKAAADAAAAAEKLARERAKAAEKAAKDAQKRVKDELERLRKEEAKRRQDGTWYWNHGLLHTLVLREGGIHPTSIPLIDEDLVPDPEETACSLDPQTWMHVGGHEAHVWASGRDVTVAVLDGGFNLNHPILARRLAPGAWDALDGDLDPNDFGNGFDDDGDGLVDGGLGHGTFIAGMVLLAAPEASILPIRVRDDEGRGPNEAVFIGILHAIVAGADVINLSVEEAHFGGFEIAAAVAEAEAQGVVVVVAAGNDGQPVAPDHPGTIVVGAVDGADVTAPFSNVALGSARAERFVYAPGVDLHGPYGHPFDASCAWWSGTSFATGIVSGAVALYLEVYRDRDPAWVAWVVTQAVDEVWTANGDVDPRCGRVNLMKVLWP